MRICLTALAVRQGCGGGGGAMFGLFSALSNTEGPAVAWALFSSCQGDGNYSTKVWQIIFRMSLGGNSKEEDGKELHVGLIDKCLLCYVVRVFLSKSVKIFFFMSLGKERTFPFLPADEVLEFLEPVYLLIIYSLGLFPWLIHLRGILFSSY